MEYQTPSEEYRERMDLLDSEEMAAQFPFIKKSSEKNFPKLLIPPISKEDKKEIDFAISLVGKLHAF